MGAKNHFKAQQFIDVIPGSAGIITTIAKRIGCDWHTVKRYIDNYATIKAAYDDECEKVLDAAESVVIGEIVEQKDIQTAKWYLTMKGSRRGYAQVQRQQNLNIDMSKLTTEQLERIAAGENPVNVLSDTSASGT